jgi:hypothetical protein
VGLSLNVYKNETYSWWIEEDEAFLGSISKFTCCMACGQAQAEVLVNVPDLSPRWGDKARQLGCFVLAPLFAYRYVPVSEADLDALAEGNENQSAPAHDVFSREYIYADHN